jgi:FkbM family methyltransferase
MLKNYIYNTLFRLGVPTSIIKKIGNLFFFFTNIMTSPMTWSGFGKYEKEIIKSYKEVSNQDISRFKSFIQTLDRESIHCSNRHIARIDYLSNQEFYKTDIVDDKEVNETKRLEPIAKMLCKSTNFQIGNYYQIETFGYHSGLKLLKSHELDYMINKDCLDCGPFTGDSAFIFSTYYNFNKIYLFEPDLCNYNTLVNNINKLKLQQCVPLNIGVGKMNEILNLNSNSGTSSISPETNKNSMKVKITSIDNFVSKKKIKGIGLIKMDIEGYEKEAILGASDTIKNFLPILSIAIYHKGDHFYNMANLIRKISDNKYNFMIRKLNPNTPIFDVFLICTPKILKSNIL